MKSSRIEDNQLLTRRRNGANVDKIRTDLSFEQEFTLVLHCDLIIQPGFYSLFVLSDSWIILRSMT